MTEPIKIVADATSYNQAINSATQNTVKLSQAEEQARQAILSATKASELQTAALNLQKASLAAANAQLLQHAIAQRAAASASSLGSAGAIPSQAVAAQIRAINGPLKAATTNTILLNAKMAQLGVTSQQAFAQASAGAAATQAASGRLLVTWQQLGRVVVFSSVYKAFSTTINLLQEGITTSLELGKQIALIQTLSQDANSTTRQWAAGLGNLSASFGIPVLDQAKAAYEALSNQMGRGIDVLSFVAEANKLAATTGATAAQAQNLLSSVINSYTLEAKDAAKISNVLFKAIDLGRFTTADYADTLGNVSVLASQAGVAFQEVFAALALFTKKGIKDAEAATQLRGILTSLIAPTKAMTKLFDEFNVTSGSDLIKTLGGLSGLFQTLQDRTQGNENALRLYVPRLRGFSGLLASMGPGLLDYKDILQQVTNSQGDFDAAFQITITSSSKKIEIFKEQIKQLFTVEIGQRAVEASAKLLDLIPAIELVKVAIVASAIPIAGGFALITKQIISLIALSPALVGFFTAAAIAAVAVTAFKIGKTLADWVNHTKQFNIELEKTENILQSSIDATTRILNTQTAKIQELIGKQIADLKKGADAAFVESGKVAEQAYKGVSEVTNEVLKDSAKAVEESLKSLDSEVDSLTKKLETIDELRKSSFNDTKEKLFEISLDKAEPNNNKQLNLIAARIREITEAKNAAVVAGNPDEVLSAEQEIIRLYERAAEIQDKSAEKRQDIQSQVAEDITKLIEKRQKLVEDFGESKTKGDPDKQESVRQQIAAVDLEIKIKQAAANAELADIGKVRAARIDLEKVIRQEYQNTQDALTAIQVKAQADRQALELKELNQRLSKEKLDSTQKRFDTLQKAFDEALAKGDEGAIRSNLAQLSATGDALKKILETADPGLDFGFISEQNTANFERATAALEQLVSGKFAKEGLIVINEAVEGIQKLTAKLAALEERQKNITVGKELGGFGQLFDDLATQGNTDVAVPSDRVEAALAESIERIKAQIQAAQSALAATSQLSMDQVREAVKGTEVETEKVDKNLQALNNTGLGNLQGAFDEVTYRITRANEALIATRALLGASADGSAQGGPVGRARGGRIQLGTDTIPTMLSPGEFVVNAKSTKRFYSQLLSMNSGMATGGPVGGSVTNVGDINLSMSSSGSASVDVQHIGKLLKREIRRGTLSLK